MGWGGRLFEAGRLLTFSAFRMGAYSRWALIRGLALIRINTVYGMDNLHLDGCDYPNFRYEWLSVSRSAVVTGCYINVLEREFLRRDRPRIDKLRMVLRSKIKKLL